MIFIAEINIMPLKTLHDPQGKIVENTLNKIGYTTINSLRIGKHIKLELEAKNKEAALIMVNEICIKLLYNHLTEGFEYEVYEKN